MTTCPECSVRVSDKAGTCPKCGYPLTDDQSLPADPEPKIIEREVVVVKESSGWWKPIVWGAVILLGIAWLSTGGLFKIGADTIFEDTIVTSAGGSNWSKDFELKKKGQLRVSVNVLNAVPIDVEVWWHFGVGEKNDYVPSTMSGSGVLEWAKTYNFPAGRYKILIWPTKGASNLKTATVEVEVHFLVDTSE